MAQNQATLSLESIWDVGKSIKWGSFFLFMLDRSDLGDCLRIDLDTPIWKFNKGSKKHWEVTELTPQPTVYILGQLSLSAYCLQCQTCVENGFWAVWTEQHSISAHTTGCRSQIRKIFEFKIWKKPMLVLKQTIHQQKALDLSFNMAP